MPGQAARKQRAHLAFGIGQEIHTLPADTALLKFTVPLFAKSWLRKHCHALQVDPRVRDLAAGT